MSENRDITERLDIMHAYLVKVDTTDIEGLNWRAAMTDDLRAHIHRLKQLTPREREVMELLVAGRTSKEVASALHVSVRTVEGHRRMVLSKANVSSAAQLVRTVLSARDTGVRT